MRTTILLLVTMGAVGSIDGLYYHLYKFRLFERPSARTETVLHVLRGFSYAFALEVLLRGVPQGGWFWTLAAVFGVDFVIDMLDVSLEPSSRAPLGGLPPREYLLHMIVMAISGGIWTSFLTSGFPLRLTPTGLAPLPAGNLPAWLLWDGRLMVFGAALLAVLELALWARARPRSGPVLGAAG